jgi:DNA invertase Pin-like site-specific DNA recombinase
MRKGVRNMARTAPLADPGKKHAGKFVAYYRVSTDRQGKSGLGLEAQQQAVLQYLNGGSWSLIGEFTEVESGRSSKRPMLEAAIKLCRDQRATLVIAKLDRLYRNAYFVSKLYHDGVDFVAADQPYANKMTVQILAAVAENEAELISQRTRAALAIVKKRGKRLGSPKPGIGGFYAGKVAAKNAEEHAAKVLPIIRDLRKAGCDTLRDLAEGLERHGVPTARGGNKWWPSAVANVLKRTG